MKVFCGIDWASDHHDVAVVDGDGKLSAGPASPTTRRACSSCSTCWPSTATASKSRSRWRSRPLADCWSPACAPPAAPSTRSTRWPPPATATATPSHGRSPTTLTPWCWRTSCAPTPHAHRPLPADSELAQAIAVLARAQQDAVWDRTQAGNKLRSHLREYFPGYLAAVQGITRRLERAAGPRPAGRRAYPQPGRPAHPHPAAGRAQARRPPARHRRRRPSACTPHSASRRCASSRWSRQAMGRQALALLRQVRRRLRRRR